MCSRTFNVATGNLFTWRGSKTLFTRFGVHVREAEKNLSVGVENRFARRVRVENHDRQDMNEGRIGASFESRSRIQPSCAPWSLQVAWRWRLHAVAEAG